MIIRKEDAVRIRKNDVDMWIYGQAEGCDLAAVAYQETDSGHTEEFMHERSAFVFFIIEGSGTWVIEDERFDVRASDVVIVPPGRRFYYKGRLKQVCVTAPAWEERYERHIRYIDPERHD